MSIRRTPCLLLASLLIVPAVSASAADLVSAPAGGRPLPGRSELAVETEADSCALEDAASAAATSPTPIASAARTAAASTAAEAQAATSRRPKAFEYSDGYRTRLKIHKYASYATLPLFAAQAVVGQKLYNGNTSDSMRSAHSALVGGTAVLFGVNTVTGLWNLSEGRKDPNHRTKRMVHGLLMMVADGGFLATGLMTPHVEREGRAPRPGGTSPSTHRALAFGSMGAATVGYLMMLFGH